MRNLKQLSTTILELPKYEGHFPFNAITINDTPINQNAWFFKKILLS